MEFLFNTTAKKFAAAVQAPDSGTLTGHQKAETVFFGNPTERSAQRFQDYLRSVNSLNK